MKQYFKDVGQTVRAVGWMLLLNVLLAVIMSLSFTSHFISPPSALDFFYQLGLLPAVWGLYAILLGMALLPLCLIPKAKWPLVLLLAIAGGHLAVILFIDNYIYEIYSYHINWFFIEAFFADEGGEFFDISLKTYVLFSFIAVLVTLAELGFLWLLEKKLLPRKSFRFSGMALSLVLFVNVLFVNLAHSWAYAQNYASITSIGVHVPFYFPMHSRSLTDNKLLASLAGDGEMEEQASSIHYPKQPMQCVKPEQQPNIIMVVLESWRGDMLTKDITPFSYQLAQQSLWFKDHHSSGNVTTKGIFALMYGIVPTYMDNVVANNGAGGPVLLNTLKDQGYEFGIFPSGDITRIKLTDSSFKPVRDQVHHGEGQDTIEKDRDILRRMKGLMANSDGPYFGFMFFNSSHYLYYYPDAMEKFTPTQKPSLVDFKAGKNPEPFLNRYKNSLFFVDELIKDLSDALKESGQWENTVLIVTSDHGEEFADTHATRFGHGSNFTPYQTQVPLIIHWPGKQAEMFEHKTTSIDVSATLLNDLLGCENPMSDYSNGESLFEKTDREVQVVASYYNHAFVTEHGSFTQNPIGLLESKNHQDQADPELKINPKLAFKALEQMKWFYQPKELVKQ